MKSFLYVQLKANDTFFEHILVDCDDISTMCRDNSNDELEGKIIIFKKSHDKHAFPINLIAEVITNNKCVARFFRGKITMANLILNFKNGKKRYFDLTGWFVTLHDHVEEGCTLSVDSDSSGWPSKIDDLKSIKTSCESLFFMITSFLHDNGFECISDNKRNNRGMFGIYLEN